MQKFTKSLFFISLIFSKSIYAQSDTSAKTLNSVVVTGQFKPQTLKNSVYQVKTISAQRIALSGATSVQQVLNNQLGFRFSNDNTLGVTDVQLNGMSGRNVKILIDGAPALDRFDQRVSLSQIDINTIDHIEIVEGPMSVSYGTDAMAGVINVITKKNYNRGFSATARAQEESAADEYYPFSYQGVHLQNLQLNYKQNNWNFSAGGTHNESNGFGGDTYGRNKSWLPKEQWFGNAKVGYRKAGIDIYYKLDGMKEMIVDRNPINFDLDINPPIARTFDQSYRSDRFMHQLQGSFKLNNKLDLGTILSYTDFKRTTKTVDKDFVAGTATLSTLDGTQDVSKLKSFTFKNTLQWTISDKLSLQPGLDINHEKADGARITGAPSIDDYALFAAAEYKLNSKISIRPGVRFMYNSKYDAPPAVPALNTKFALNKNLDLRLSYGYGFRAPALRELYFNFQDANHNLVGNPDLKAETSNSFNGSLSWAPAEMKKIGFSSTLGAFYNNYKNQITLAEDVNVPGQFKYFNAEKTKNTGFNIDNTIAYKNLQASLGFAYIGLSSPLTANTYKNDSRDYMWTPEINSNITYNLKKIHTSFGLFYKFTGKKPAFSYETTGVTQPGYYVTETNSYNLADFTVTTRVNRFASIAAGVKNIFDVNNVNSTTVVSSNSAHSSGGALAVSYGRSYFLGLNLQWNKK